MRNLLKYLLLHIVCFGGFFSLSAGENAPHEDKYNIQDEIIYSFHTSMGFDYLTKEESDMIPTDSILDYLEASKQYKTYFELLLNHFSFGEKFVLLLHKVNRCILRQVYGPIIWGWLLP